MLSSKARNDIPIGFSSRFAEELHSQLTIMHIIPEGNRRWRRSKDELPNFMSRLPSDILEEARHICPIDISVKHGDPIAEVLDYDIKFKQDFLILAPNPTPSLQDLDMRVARQMIRQARCPVIVLTEHSDSEN